MALATWSSTEGPAGRSLGIDRNLCVAVVSSLLAGSVGKNPAIYSFLEEATGVAVTTIDQDIQAVSMPPYVKQSLGNPAIDLSLRILRRYKSSTKTVLASFNWHLGEDNFIFSSSLKQKAHE